MVFILKPDMVSTQIYGKLIFWRVCKNIQGVFQLVTDLLILGEFMNWILLSIKSVEKLIIYTLCNPGKSM